MDKFRAKLLGGALALALSAGAAFAGGFLTNGIPTVGGAGGTALPLTGAESIPIDTNLAAGVNPQSEAVTTGQMADFARGRAGAGAYQNALRGGDFGTNPFQRGTSATGVVGTAVYTADGWAEFAGVATSSQWSQQTGAGDITPEYAGSLRIQRTSGQTGVLPVCIMQPLTSPDSTRFQGHKAVFQFSAQVGANFSAASNNVTASIVTGTGNNETTANFAAGTWTGSAVAGTATIPLTATYINGSPAALTTYSVSAAIPATATELGVKICYTPVGTAGANDWFEFTGASLAVSDSGAPVAFEHLPVAVELARDQGYFWQISEVSLLRPFMGQALTTTTANIQIQYPVPMWKAPTPAYTAGTWAATVAAGTTSGTCTSLAAVASTTTRQGTVALCTVAAGLAAGNATQLLGAGTTGILSASAEL